MLPTGPNFNGGNMPVGGMPQAFNPAPIIPVVQRILSDMGAAQTVGAAVDCLDSSALSNVCLVSLKCAPYAFLNENALVQEFDNGISCRLRYLEAAVTSTASLVYNVVFGVVFTVLSVVTLGQVKLLCTQMRKAWIHAGLAGAAIGVSAVGTVSPEWGIKANGVALLAGGAALLQWMQGDIVQKFCTAYQAHNVELVQAVLAGVNDNEEVYNRQFAPLFNYLSTNLNDQVQTLSDVMRVAQGASQHCQTAILPIVTGVFMQNFAQTLGNAGTMRPSYSPNLG